MSTRSGAIQVARPNPWKGYALILTLVAALVGGIVGLSTIDSPDRSAAVAEAGTVAPALDAASMDAYREYTAGLTRSIFPSSYAGVREQGAGLALNPGIFNSFAGIREQGAVLTTVFPSSFASVREQGAALPLTSTAFENSMSAIREQGGTGLVSALPPWVTGQVCHQCR